MSTMSGLHLEQLQEVVEQQRAEIERLRLKVPDRDKLLAEIERLRALVRTMIDEDPNDLAADGGITVLDVWRKEARRVMGRPLEAPDARALMPELAVIRAVMFGKGD